MPLNFFLIFSRSPGVVIKKGEFHGATSSFQKPHHTFYLQVCQLS